MSALADRIAGLPRALQWALIAAVGLVAYFTWEQFIDTRAKAWGSEADRIERMVSEVRRGESLTRAARAKRAIITGLGPVQLPIDEEASRTGVARLVAETLKNYPTVSNDSFNLGRGVTNLPRTISDRVVTDRQQRLVQITGDLRFDASPEDAMAVLAEFEARPEIESVSQIRFLRQNGRTVSITMKLDAWVLQDRQNRAR